MKVSVEYVQAHFWEVLEVATDGVEVEIERPGEAIIYVTLNSAGDAWKHSKNRRQPETVQT